MQLNKLINYKDFKIIKNRLNEKIVGDYAANSTGFSQSLLGRGVISLFKFLKRGSDYLKLELYKRKYENELAIGILRAYQEIMVDIENKKEEEKEEEQHNEEPQKEPQKEPQTKLIEINKNNKIVKYKNDYLLNIDNDYSLILYDNKLQKVKLNNDKLQVIDTIEIKSIDNLEQCKAVLKILNTYYQNNNEININYQDVIDMFENLSDDILSSKDLQYYIRDIFSKVKDPNLKKYLRSILMKYKDIAQDGNINKSIEKNKNDIKITIKKLLNKSQLDDNDKKIISNLIKEYKNKDSIYWDENIISLIKDLEKKIKIKIVPETNLLKANESFLFEKSSKFKKIYGEPTELNWDLFEGENAKIMFKHFNSKEYGDNLRKKATYYVSKEAIAAIQYSVQSAIQHTETPNSSKLFPNQGGGITESETYLARIWKKMVNNIKAKFKTYLNLDEVDPYNIIKNTRPNEKDIKNLFNDVNSIEKDINIISDFKKINKFKIIEDKLDINKNIYMQYENTENSKNIYFIKIIKNKNNWELSNSKYKFDGKENKKIGTILNFEKNLILNKVDEFNKNILNKNWGLTKRSVIINFNNYTDELRNNNFELNIIRVFQKINNE